MRNLLISYNNKPFQEPIQYIKEKTTNKKFKINSQITAANVRLINVDGKQEGIIPFETAIRMAEENGQDLVEVSVNNEIPVCKIMDYGKFKYRQTKKAHEAKQKQKNIQIKEIKIRPQTDDGDYQTKLRKLINFLKAGDKTKITVRFRGREIQHQELGMKVLERIQNDLQEYSTIEHYPSMEGRQMVMILNPISRTTKGSKSAKTPKPTTDKPITEKSIPNKAIT